MCPVLPATILIGLVLLYWLMVIFSGLGIDLIGKSCTVTTKEVTDTFGEANLETEGTPLILNVRFAEGTLQKGEVCFIESYVIEHNNLIFVKI